MRICILLLFTLSIFTARAQPMGKASEILSNGSHSVAVHTFESFSSGLKADNDTLYIFNFWATWCRPCVAELPHFEAMKDSLKDKKIKIILVSLDSRKKAETDLLPFLERKKLRNEVILLNAPDFNSWIDKISPDWSGSIPATLMVRQGRSAFYEQDFEFGHLKHQIEHQYQNL